MSKYDGFKNVKLTRPQRSTFDMSHEKKLSCRMGQLVPIMMEETLPNDTWYGNTEVLLKLAPMLAPVFHRVNVYVHHFFVPNRLIWSGWENFITGGRLGTETPPVPPYCDIQDILALGDNRMNYGSLADYLGLPILVDGAAATWANKPIHLMPFNAFYKVWYDYYRDRNYNPDNTLLPMGNGSQLADLSTLTAIYRRCWEHDYFTSALPWTQRGDEVLMPMEASGTDWYSTATGNPATAEKYLGIYSSGDPGATAFGDSFDPGVNMERVELLVENSEISINDFRTAIRLQEWLERNALAGSRYNESIMAHFGRKTSDGRLQRAEYLGGGKAVVKIDEVMTTAWSQDDSAADIPPANPSGAGSTYANTNKFSYNCEEHGFIVSILSIMPATAYDQGIPRRFRRRWSYLDYAWPSFAHLGEQPVYKSEVYGVDPANTSNVPADEDDAVFGYQSRYADWKQVLSTNHGDFRSTGSLNYWTLTRNFTSNPVIGATFNTFTDALQDRIFAVSGVDTCWVYLYNNFKAKRSLPYYGTPTI